MSSAIKTNILDVNIDYKKISSMYSFLRISTTDKYISSGSFLLDAPLLSDIVCSVKFENNKNFYVMYKSGGNNYSSIIKSIKSHKESDYLVFTDAAVTQIPQNILVQLLFNNLANYSNKFLRINNLTGHFYCFHPDWIKRKKTSNEQLIWQIPSLEISINSDMSLSLNVRTFTSEILKSKLGISKEKFDKLPKYVLSAHNTMRRKLRSDNGTAFILRQLKGKKTEIPFINLHNIEYFARSKMGVLENVIRSFNEQYSGVCSIAFKEINNYLSVDHSRNIAKENELLIKKLLSENNIKIIDEINDAYSAQFISDIQSLLKEKYGIIAKIGKRVSKDCLNIKLIHNKEYYDNSNDPHRTYSDLSVQHITLEDFSGSAKYAISTIVHELLIKDDLANNKITLFNWQSLNIYDDMVFGACYQIDDMKRYFFMTIKPDGSFIIEEREFDLFSFDEYSEYVNIFQDDANIRGIVKNTAGEINIIKNTDWFTIPEIQRIHNELDFGNTRIRSKEKREELLPSVLDIKYFDMDNSKYYFVGTIGNGMNRSINNAANIREIVGYKNSNIFFDELLSLMNVTFVRNGQLTVQPFPFKYLKEYVRYYLACSEGEL